MVIRDVKVNIYTSSNSFRHSLSDCINGIITDLDDAQLNKQRAYNEVVIDRFRIRDDLKIAGTPSR